MKFCFWNESLLLCSQGQESPPQPVSKVEQYFDNSNVECAIQLCPELLKKGY